VGQGSRALIRVQTRSGRFKVQWGDQPEESCYSVYSLNDDKSTNTSGLTHLKLRCEMNNATEKISEEAK
jgi:outer membrane usher protein FimD/PapC